MRQSIGYQSLGSVEENKFFTFPVILVIGAVIGVTYWLYISSYPYIKTLNWTKGTGVITEILSRNEIEKYKTEREHNNEPNFANYKFIYSYEVDGKQYTGQGEKDVSLLFEKNYLQRIKGDEKALSESPNDINLKKSIEKRKNSLVERGSQIEILFNPELPDESMLYVGQASVLCLIGIIVLFYIYVARLLLIFYSKLKFRYCFNELMVKDILSQQKLPLELCNKKYWSILGFGLCHIKSDIQKDKKKNILRLKTAKYGMMKYLAWIAVWMIVIISLGIKADIGNLFCFLTLPVAFLPIFEMYFMSNFPRGEFDKDLNEYYYYEGGKNREKIQVSSLSNITALQILPLFNWNETIVGYQVNVIYNPNNSEVVLNGEYDRNYVFSYKRFDSVKEIAEKISAFINVPVVYDLDIVR